MKNASRPTPASHLPVQPDLGVTRLRSFIVLAEELHFGRAASHRRLSQPALSQQIASLERDIGAPLFERSGRSVTLTPSGREFLKGVRQAVAALDRAAEAALHAARARRQVLLGHTGTASRGCVAMFIRMAEARHPELTIVPRLCFFGDHLRLLRDGSVDLGLIRPPYSDQVLAGVDTRTIGAEARALMLPAGHPLAGRMSLVTADALSMRLAVPRRDVCGVWSSFWALDGPRGGPDPDAYEVDSLEDMVTVVAAGLAAAIVPASLGAEISGRTVRLVPLADATPSLVALAWSSSLTLSGLPALIELAAESWRQQPPQVVR